MLLRLRAASVGLVGLAVFAHASFADVLHLKRGGRLEGILVNETPSTITLDVGMGLISVPRATVLRIERKDGALAEFRRRLQDIAPGDVNAYAELARFAKEHGLNSEARSVWTRVVSLDPRNVEAHLALGHVLLGGAYVDEDEAYRARGYISFEGRWMTKAEQESLLRSRERRADDEVKIAEARRAARAAEDRARRAEADAAQARATAASSPAWGYGGPVLVGSPRFGGYTAGCSGVACATVPQIWPVPPPAPAATPLPRVPPPRPSSIR